jgi:hypothetical protein
VSDLIGEKPTVVISEDHPATPPKPTRGVTPPKWETETREKLRTVLRRFSKPLGDLVTRDANEGDTRLFVTDFLTDALGYDKYEDLTTEYQVRGEFADYGVRIDRDLVAFIEVKRVATKLGAKHLRQVELYAVNEGVEWMVLTNGVQWRAYHVSAGLPVEIDLTLEVDLLSDAPPAQKVNDLFYLTRPSLKRRQIDELWKSTRAKSPKSLANALTSPAVTDAIRKELRRTTKQNIDAKEIERVLRATVIRPECF